MPIPLRPLDQVVGKWQRRAAAAAPDYTAAVQTPLKDWQKGSLAASDAWKAAVTDAAGRDAYKAGVAKQTTAFWQKRALELGAPRFADGVSKSVDVYNTKFGPFYDALGRIELPARGPRGDPRNIERVRTIMETLRRVKITGK